MRAPRIGQRTGYAPDYATVDWSNQLTTRLRAFHRPIGSGLVDLASGIKVPRSASPARAVGRWGPGMANTAATNDGATLVIGTTHRLSIQPPISFMWAATVTATPANQAVFYGVSASNADAAPYACFFFALAGGTNQAPTVIVNSAGTVSNVAVAATDITVGPHVFVGVVAAGGSSIYVDGAVAGTGVGVTAITYSATSTLSVNQYPTGRATNCIFHAGAIWNRALNATEAAALSADPFTVLRW